MSHYPFPNTIYDQPQNLLAVLGSWWADDYAGTAQVSSIVRGKAQVESQTMLDVMELIASLSRFTVPIYHTDNWYPLYVKASERNDAQTSLAKYDDGTLYDDGVQYDIPQQQPHHAFPKPGDLASAPLLMNRFTDPTLTQNEGIDYLVTDDAVIFRSNPFDDPRVAQRPVYQDGVQIDTEALLWVYRGEFDWDTTYRQFGYVIGARLESSAGYRDLMNAIYDAMVGGTTAADIMRAFSAMTGVPLVREANETVVDIVADTQSLIIITDLSVYKFGLDAEPIVEVGDPLVRGQAMTDALRFYEFNRGDTPTNLRALALGEGMLSTCFYADLIFENRDVPLVVDAADPSGYTRVTFDLGGFPLDVDQFFDDLHARGVAEAERVIDPCETDIRTVRYPASDCDETEYLGRRGTLAHLLDLRAEQVGEPTASHLPTTINPLRFLIENVLRNNAFLVRMKANSAGNGGVGLHNVRLLRKVAPPHTAMLLVVDLTAAKDSVTVDNINEQVSTFVGMTPLHDVVDMVSDSRVTIRIINGTCQ